MYVNDVPNIQAFALQEQQNQGNQQISFIPVRFTVLRNDDGSSTGGNTDLIDDIVIDNALSNLNQAFAGNQFEFYNCCNVTYVNNTELHTNSAAFSSINGTQGFAYTSSTLNVIIARPSSYNYGFTDQPCYPDPCSGNPPDNDMELGGYSNLTGPLFIHETGHHFGLLHTFGRPKRYYVPAIYAAYWDPILGPGQVWLDHPYQGEERFRRELVLREQDNDPFTHRTFLTPNCSYVGDMICDTSPGCRTTDDEFNFPSSTDPDHPNCNDPADFMPDGSATGTSAVSACNGGCAYNSSDCTSIGAYVDYNGDLVTDHSWVRNYMSYTGSCRQEFTPEQLNVRIPYYHSYRVGQYENDLCDNLNDIVEFEGTDEGMDRIIIQFQHPTDDRYCSVATASDGKFHGISYADETTANVVFLGTGKGLEYTYEDWVKDVDITDFWILQLAINSFPQPDAFHSLLPTGYSIIAADVNNDGMVNNTDRDLVRDLILGNIQSFPNHEQPYRFTPEYIPLDHSAQFNTMPFNMTLDGLTYNNEAPYLESDWEFLVPNGNNGKSGFDAIKLGDVHHPKEKTLPPIIISYTKEVEAGDIVKFNFQVENFIEITAYQMEIGFDTSQLIYQTANPRDLVGVVPEMFGTTQAENGIIKTFWTDESNMNAITLNDFDEIFQLVFNGIGQYASAEVWLNEFIFTDTSDLTPRAASQKEVFNSKNFAIDKNGNIRPIILKETNQPKIKDVKNYPNPFETELNIDIESRQTVLAKIQIHNTLGQLLHQSNENLKKGSNKIEFTDFANLSAGFMFVSIHTRGETISKKIIKLN